MTLIALIRHGQTLWNTEGRMQGRADIPLSPAGIAEMKALGVPPDLRGAVWLSSPLKRARQTAAILHGGHRVDDRLIEGDWAAWEGLASAVTAPHAARIAARGQAGLDFRPPGGESPRDIQRRLMALFIELAPKGGTYAAVTHKGVIRAAFSLATGWDMRTKPPVKLVWRAAHLFDIAADGSIALRAANIAMRRPA
jgi:probable phosphoglycerate mutase